MTNQFTSPMGILCLVQGVSHPRLFLLIRMLTVTHKYTCIWPNEHMGCCGPWSRRGQPTTTDISINKVLIKWAFCWIYPWAGQVSVVSVNKMIFIAGTTSRLLRVCFYILCPCFPLPVFLHAGYIYCILYRCIYILLYGIVYLCILCLWWNNHEYERHAFLPTLF